MLTVRVSSGPIQVKSARKILHLLELLVKLDEGSLSCARKPFANARLLGYSLKLSVVLSGSIICSLETKFDAGKHICMLEALLSFSRFIETDTGKNSSRRAPAEVEWRL